MNGCPMEVGNVVRDQIVDSVNQWSLLCCVYGAPYGPGVFGHSQDHIHIVMARDCCEISRGGVRVCRVDGGPITRYSLERLGLHTLDYRHCRHGTNGFEVGAVPFTL